MHRFGIASVVLAVTLLTPAGALRPAEVGARVPAAGAVQVDPRYLPGGSFARSWGIRVTDVETAGVLGEESGVPVYADGVFLAIRMEVTNLTDRPAEFSSALLTLRDRDGRTYDPDPAAEARYVLAETDIADYQPEPGDPTGWYPGAAHDAGVVFDVPEDAGGFALESIDGTSSVDLRDAAGSGNPDSTSDAEPDPAADGGRDDGTGLTPSEEAYLGGVVGQIKDLTESWDRFSPLLRAYTDGDGVSAERVAEELALWQEAYDDAQAIVPPPRLDAIHDKNLEMLALWSEASAEIADGMDNDDPDLLESGLDKIGEAIDLIPEIDGMIEDAAAGEVTTATTKAVTRVVSCDEAREWADEWSAETERAEAILDEVVAAGMFDDPAAFADDFDGYADEFADMVATLRQIDPLPATADATGLLVEAFDAYREGFARLASAVRLNSQVLADEGSARINDGSESLGQFNDEFSALVDSCEERGNSVTVPEREAEATRKPEATASAGGGDGSSAPQSDPCGEDAPAKYDVVFEDVQAVGDGEQYVAKVVVPDQIPQGAVAAALAEAVRKGYARHEDAEEIIVFGYRPGDDTEREFTLGKAVARPGAEAEEGLAFAEGNIFVVLNGPDGQYQYGFPLDC